MQIIVYLALFLQLSLAIPCNRLIVRGTCQDLACEGRTPDDSGRLVKTVVPSSENVEITNFVPGDKMKVISFSINALSGTYQNGQPTRFSLLADAGNNANQKLGVQIEYDFDGNGIVDRTERFILDLDGTQGYQNISGNSFEGGVIQGAYSQLNQGNVKVSFWSAAASTLSLLLETNGGDSVISIPYADASQEGDDPCKPSCNCVAFRLDDIQDYYVANTQQSVMNQFKDTNTPLTVGIIGNVFGDDSFIVNYILLGLLNANWDLELANHGRYHQAFNLFTREEQLDRMQYTNNKIHTLTGVTPKTFIPPFNTFNDDTISVLEELEFTHMSSQIVVDPRPYDFSPPQSLYRFPTAASTSDFYVTDSFAHVPHTKTWEQIQSQLTQDGFSVVMMHPYEFAAPGVNNTYIDTPNTDKLNDLATLIQTIKNAGLQIVTIGKIAGNPTQPPTTTQPPSTTTPSPTTPAPTTQAPSTQPPDTDTQDPIDDLEETGGSANILPFIIVGAVGGVLLIGIVLGIVFWRVRKNKLVFSNGTA